MPRSNVSSEGSGADLEVEPDEEDFAPKSPRVLDGDDEEGGDVAGGATSTAAVLRGEEVDLPDEKTLHEYFEATVRSQRDGVAVAELPAIVNLASSKPAPTAGAEEPQPTVLTFGQVNSFANLLARQLRNQLMLSASSSPSLTRASSFDANNVPIDPPKLQPIIAIWMPPSEFRIITMLAIWKLNGTVLILDHSLPDHRILAMCDENRPQGVVGSAQDPDYRGRISNLFRRTKYHLIDFEGLLMQDAEQSDSDLARDETLVVINHQVQPNTFADEPGQDKLAVIIYTSGSTGLNKGVCLSHKNLLNRLYWQWIEIAYRPGDCCISKTSILFVDFLTETFAPLLEAVRLVVVDRATAADVRKLLPVIDRHRITRLVLVPSVLEASLSYLATLPKAGKYLKELKLVICSGEALPHSLAVKFFDRMPHCTLANFYGSTEVTGDVTFQLFHSKEEVEQCTINNMLSIGRPIYNTHIYLLTDSWDGDPANASSTVSLAVSYQLCGQPGQLGAIYVSGNNVAARYVAATTSTDLQGVDSFVRNPFNTQNKPQFDILYRTGDYGRIVNGQLIYEGRRDGIIKLRGQKISLSELERAIITQCPQLNGQVIVKQVSLNTSASAKDSTSASQNIQLVAFYAQGSSGLKPADIVAKTRKYFPDYVTFEAVPIQGEKLPLQAHTGKIDRRGLVNYYLDQKSREAGQPPKIAIASSPASNAIIRALGMPSADQLDGAKTFFEMGGNSLNSIMAIAYLHQAGFQSADLERLLTAKNLHEFLGQLAPAAPTSSSSANRPPPPPRPAIAPRTSVSNSSPYGRYKLLKLNELPKERYEEVIEMTSESFVATNPLDVLNATSKETFAKMIRSLWHALLADGMSLVALDSQQSNNAVVGSMFNLDITTEVAMDPDVLAQSDHIIRINDDVEAPVRAELLKQGGRFVDFKFVAVANQVRDQAERAAILNALETQFLRLAKTSGYDGVITVSSHAATQEIEEKIYGYQVRNILHVNSYRIGTWQPFKHAPDDYYLKCLTKMLAK